MVLRGMKWPYWSVICLPVNIQCYVNTYTNLNEILYTYIDVYILNHTHTHNTLHKTMYQQNFGAY